MKKVLIIFIMFITSITFSQEVKETATKTFDDVIKQWVEKALPVLEEGAEFVMEETPIVIKQYLLFESVSYGLLIVLGILFLTFLRKYLTNLILKKSDASPKSEGEKDYIKYREVSSKKWLRYDGANDADVTIEQIVYPFFKYGSYIVGFSLIVSNISTFIKVTFFPKLYLVEKFIELI